MRKLIKLIRKFLRENKFDQYLTKKYLDCALIVFSLLFGFYLQWDIQNIALFSYAIWIVLNPISSRILARVALYLLFFVPLLLIIKRNNQAEQFAVFAFYFLILTLIMAIIEFKKKRKIEALSDKRQI